MSNEPTKQAQPPLILASGSPYRAALLRRLGLTFTQISPAIDESVKAGESAPELAERLAREKAAAVAQSHPGYIVVGSDQVPSLKGHLLGKPGTVARAREQLTQCSGQNLTFYTGLCVIGPEEGQCNSLVEAFSVQFRTLSPLQISRYVDAELPLDCAGSFKVEGLGISLFEKLEGKDPNTLIGLPVISLITLLNQRGIAIP